MNTTAKYVAVNFDFYRSDLDKIQCTANRDMTIQGTNGASVTLRKGEQFYAVRASSLGENMWYIVRNVVGEKKCSCPARKPCKHEVAVATGCAIVQVERVKSNKVKATKPVVVKSAQVVVSPESEHIVKEQPKAQKAQIHAPKLPAKKQASSEEKMQRASLNGSKAFSLMR